MRFFQTLVGSCFCFLVGRDRVAFVAVWFLNSFFGGRHIGQRSSNQGADVGVVVGDHSIPYYHGLHVGDGGVGGLSQIELVDQGPNYIHSFLQGIDVEVRQLASFCNHIHISNVCHKLGK
jgi:hypothetical protein